MESKLFGVSEIFTPTDTVHIYVNRQSNLNAEGNVWTPVFLYG